MASRILVVCTANICRSPVAERLLHRHLTAAGHTATVRSAGTDGGRLDVHRDTLTAAADLGIDLGDHTSRRLTRQLVIDDGSDLVITMSREHLRSVVAIEPAAWPRTFTLKELTRRALDTAPDASVGMPADTIAGWLAAVGTGRRAAELMRPDPADDLDDPYGGPSSGHTQMAHDVDRLTARLAHLLPKIA